MLAGSIKYPWNHERAKTKKHPKFGAYRTEEIDFKFARIFHETEDPSIEAALMDYADDIAYSVHDIEDFHRIRAVPWYLLDVSRGEDNEARALELIDAAQSTWHNATNDPRARLVEAQKNIVLITERYGRIYNEAYEGTKTQRVSLREWTSNFIRRFVRDLRPKIVQTTEGNFKLEIDPVAEAEIRLLKQITRSFIIEGAAIGGQQLGQRRIVQEVYADLIGDIAPHRSTGAKLHLIPKKFRHLMQDEIDPTANMAVPVSNARIVADMIASLTERELVAFHGRLRGISGGSIVDPIVW